MPFDAEKTTNEIISFVRKYYTSNNLKGCVLGISGGKDSGVVAALMVKALGAENVIGVTLPCHSKEEDAADAKLISDYYSFKLLNLDLTPAFDSFKDEIEKLGNFTEEQTLNSDINLKPRLRMAAQYYLAALLSALNGGTYLVAGTSNKCELYVGYFTKGGDSVHDIEPISDLTVSEVIKIGEYLKVPEKVLYKTPADGLSNQSDEEKLGVSYRDIERYLENDESLDYDTEAKIERLHLNNMHKFIIPSFKKS